MKTVLACLVLLFVFVFVGCDGQIEIAPLKVDGNAKIDGRVDGKMDLNINHRIDFYFHKGGSRDEFEVRAMG